MAKWESAPLLDESTTAPKWAAAPLLDDAPIDNPGNTRPEVSRIPAGAGTAETVARAALPRSFQSAEQGAGMVRQAMSGALDALSLPGRAVAAAVDKPITPFAYAGTNYAPKSGEQGSFTPEGGRQFAQSMADTEGKTLPGRIVRDPALIPSLATGGAIARGALGLGLKGLKAASAIGGALGAESGAIHQADNAVQGKDVSLGSAALETAAGAAIPVALIGGARGLSALGRGIKSTGANAVESVIKPLDAAKGEGFDVENLFKNKLEGSSLRPSKWLEQSQEKIAAIRKAEGGKLNKALIESGAKFDGMEEINKVAAKMAEEVKSGNLDPEGARRAIEIYTARVNSASDPETGLISAEALNNIKRRAQTDAQAMYRAANLGTDANATEKQIVARSLAGNVRGTLEDAIPGVVEPNRILSETKPFVRSVQKASDRLAKNDGISLKGSVLASGIGAALGAPLGPAGAGAGAAAIPGAVYLANKALKNPAIGTSLYRLGGGLERFGSNIDRVLTSPFIPKTGKEISPETLAELAALREPLNLNVNQSVGGRKVFPQPNVRRPLGEPPLPALRRPLPTEGLPPRQSSLSYPRRPLGAYNPEMDVGALGDVRAAEADRALAPLPPRRPVGNIPSNFPPPNQESDAVRYILDNSGRRELPNQALARIEEALKTAKGAERVRLLNERAAINWRRE